MAQYNAYRLINELTEALEGSVPRQHHTEVLTALNRCREMIGLLATVLAETDKEQKHGELMLEAKLYANILNGYFETAGRDFGFRDIKDSFNPREYLKDKGVISSEVVKAAAEKAEERAKELRVDRIARYMDRRAEKAREVDELISQITRKPKKRGRPIGSKNKPKAMTIKELEATLSKQTKRPVHKPRSKQGRKVGSKNKTSGARK